MNYFHPEQTPPVEAQGFAPSSEDFDGLSLYRALFVKPEDVASGRSPKGYVVVKLLASDILDLGIHIIHKPIENALEGHCIIPEINIKIKSKFRRDKQDSLSRLIDQDSIVFSPDDTI